MLVEKEDDVVVSLAGKLADHGDVPSPNTRSEKRVVGVLSRAALKQVAKPFIPVAFEASGAKVFR